MSLSTLNIDNLIEKVTDQFISHSDYTTLRNTSIVPSPVLIVTKEIEEELNRLRKIDAQKSETELFLNACQAQIQEDANEKDHDLEEKAKDLKLTSQLRMELIDIQKYMGMNSVAIQSDESNIHYLELSINALERQITLSLQKNTHVHPGNTNQHQKNTHTHDETSAPDYKNIHLHDHTHSHSESRHQHNHAESSFESQKRTLSQQLSLLRNELNIKQSNQRKYQSRVPEIENQLNFVLFEKEKQREIREIVRNQRERARLANAPALSPKNSLSLQQAITAANDKLLRKQEQLMRTVNDTSYQTYLARLKIHLPSLSKLDFYEKEALSQIIQLMQDYLRTKTIEHKERTERNALHCVKEKLILDLHQKKEQISRLKKSNPQLECQNLQLNKTNQQLEKTSAEHAENRKQLLKTAPFGLLFTGAAVGGGFLVMNMMQTLATSLIPLIFSPAAVCGLITLGVLIAVLVYTIKNNTNSNQLEENKATIKGNQIKISEQNKEISSLEQKEIPPLHDLISEYERNISSVDKRIISLQEQAELQWSKAKQINVVSTSNQTFFDEAPVLYESLADIKPSAPPLEDCEQTNNLSCNKNGYGM